MSAFKPDPGFEAQLREQAGVRHTIAGAANEAAGRARSFAHRIMPAGRGQNIGVEEQGEDVYLVNYDHGGHLDEWGSVHNPPYAPLRRGAGAVRGVRLDEHGD